MSAIDVEIDVLVWTILGGVFYDLFTSNKVTKRDGVPD